MEAINHISGIKPTLKRLLYADQLAKQHTVTKLSKLIRQRYSGHKGAHTKSAHPESITALSQHAFYNFLLFFEFAYILFFVTTKYNVSDTN